MSNGWKEKVKDPLPEQWKPPIAPSDPVPPVGPCDPLPEQYVPPERVT